MSKIFGTIQSLVEREGSTRARIQELSQRISYLELEQPNLRREFFSNLFKNLSGESRLFFERFCLGQSSIDWLSWLITTKIDESIGFYDAVLLGGIFIDERVLDYYNWPNVEEAKRASEELDKEFSPYGFSFVFEPWEDGLGKIGFYYGNPKTICP